MKPLKPVALATWMLEHLTFGPHHEALAGDLLEQFRHGRSAGWYRRQVLSAIGIGIFRKFQECLPPLLFSLSWSMFYPALWFCLVKTHPVQTMFGWWTASEWAYSSGLKPVSETIPAILFLWIGLLVYLLSHRHKLSPLQLLRGFSISLNVLFLGFFLHIGHPTLDVTRESFLTNSHLIATCIQLAVSLFAAIAFTLPFRRHHGAASLG